jgi:transketolase N-terminal domain/subunit
MEQAKPKGLTDAELDQLAINTIRTLSIDAVQQAQSGHPGTPMALAPLVYTLWNNVLRFDPKDPIWPNRDRFVLSNGHASMLLWSVLFLTETRAVNADYERLGQPSVTLDDIRHFRQLASKAPGHPEYHWVSGVETTTGPLGQGVATSVGMAIARKWLGSRYNRPGFEIFDYDVYAICGDGCLMEGISSEAASLAGHLQLDDLCWIYDNNHITIEGNTSIAFTEDVAARFLAYRWNVLRVGDANDLQRIQDALAIFQKTRDRPTLIILDSHIGYGSPHKVDSPEAHGEPLGEDEVRLTKRAYHWPEDAKFFVPDGVMERFARGIGARGNKARREWETLVDGYRTRFPELATEIDEMQRRDLPAGWDRNLPNFPPDAKGIAGRDASGQGLNALAQNIPWMLGGSGDLGPSNRTTLKFAGAGDFAAETPGGRNLHFGIREHSMAAIVNGLSLSKLRAFLAHGLNGPLPEDRRFHLAHGALHSEQEPVIGRAGIIDGFLIDDERADQAAELKQGMPVAAVSGQTRCFERHHRSNALFANCSQQSLESGPRRPPTGSPEIVVDDFDLVPAELPSTLNQAILTPLALEIVDDLIGRRLTDINESSASQVGRQNLTHCPSPFRRWSEAVWRPSSPLPSAEPGEARPPSGDRRLSYRPVESGVRTDPFAREVAFSLPNPPGRLSAGRQATRSSRRLRNRRRWPMGRRGAVTISSNADSGSNIQPGTWAELPCCRRIKKEFSPPCS